MGDDLGIPPSNLDQGYVLRRLLRLAVRHARKLGIEGPVLADLARLVIDTEEGTHPELARSRARVLEWAAQEEAQFEKTLQSGIREFEKLLPNLLKNPQRTIPGRVAFRLYDTYGFPVEFTAELAREHGMDVDLEGYGQALEKHRELSRAGLDRKFGGGLADHSDMVTKLHTATHLLHAALRRVLGHHVEQKGSNITHERLRFDFSHPAPMTDVEIRTVEEIVNEAIRADLPVTCEEVPVEEAERRGAIGLFKDRYGQVVKVYSIRGASVEICGGPHVERTGGMGRFVIQSEKSSSQGVRRIRAVLE
jgi:alanyl-tRNA synthetase